MLPGAAVQSSVVIPSSTVTISGQGREHSSFSLERELSWLSASPPDGVRSATGEMVGPPALPRTGSPWFNPWRDAAPEVPAAGEPVTADVTLTVPSPAGDLTMTQRVLTGVCQSARAQIGEEVTVPVADRWDSLIADVAFDASGVPGHPLGAVAMLARTVGMTSIQPPISGAVVDVPLQGCCEPQVNTVGLVATPTVRLEGTPSFIPVIDSVWGPVVAGLTASWTTTDPALMKQSGVQDGWGFHVQTVIGSNPVSGVTPSALVTVASAAGGLELKVTETTVTVTATAQRTLTASAPVVGARHRWTVTVLTETSGYLQVRVWKDDAVVISVRWPSTPMPGKAVFDPWTISVSTPATSICGLQLWPQAQAVVPPILTERQPTMVWRLFGYDVTTANRVPARPALRGSAAALLSECASRMGAGLHLDEQGRLVWTSWRWFSRSADPDLVIDTDTGIAAIKHESATKDMPSRVAVRRRVASLSAEKRAAYVCKDVQISPGRRHEEIFGPETDTDWDRLMEAVYSYEKFQQLKSCFEWQHQGVSANSVGIRNGVNRVPGQPKWMWWVENPAENPSPITLRFTTGPVVGSSSPIFRAEHVITWSEAKRSGTQVFNPAGREYVHDGDWMLTDSEAKAIVGNLEDQLMMDAPSIRELSIWPDPRIQLGDKIRIDFADGSGTPAVQLTCFVSRINLTVKAGEMSQTLSLRVVGAAMPAGVIA